MLDQFAEKKVNKLSVFLSNHHCRKCGGLNVGNADSASTRHRVAVGLNHIPELNLPTTCDTFCNFTIPSPARDSGVRLETIREANSLMNETIAILAPVEVDNGVVAGVGVRESHGWFPVDVPNIGHYGGSAAPLCHLLNCPQKISVQRSCCTLLIRPSFSMLSQTLQNTSNFWRRVRSVSLAVSPMTLRTFPLSIVVRLN